MLGTTIGKALKTRYACFALQVGGQHNQRERQDDDHGRLHALGAGGAAAAASSSHNHAKGSCARPEPVLADDRVSVFDLIAMAAAAHGRT